MGIHTQGKLMVGLWVSELTEAGVDEDKVEELLDDENLNYASPYYDSPRDQWFVGIEVEAGEVDDPVFDKLKEARDQFRAIFNVEPRVEGLADVY